MLLVPPLFAGDPGDDEPYLPAREYLAGQFRVKDLIFVGEAHRVKEHAEFIARMIPVLHRNGINLLFSEFAGFGDSALIDRLITAETYDDSLARQVAWNDSWDWAYKEYLDVYRAAWEVNRNLNPGEAPFRIIGLESRRYSGKDPETVWAERIRKRSLDAGEKALVWCGLHHAFTSYYHPYYINDTLNGFVTSRLGNILYRKYPARVMTVVLHAPLRAAPGAPVDNVIPGGGAIDSVVASLPDSLQEIGFSTNETRLGNCSLENTFYATGYVSFALKHLCHGYIVVKPVCSLHMVTLIPGFIRASNLKGTRKEAGMGDLEAAAFNDSIRSWLEAESRFLIDVQERECR